MQGEIKLFSGCSNNPLASEIAAHLGRSLNTLHSKRFSDGEISIVVGETVRGQDVFVIQSLSSPVNDHLMELLITMDALKRASAGRITAVIPYYGYARQDRQTAPRTPITAKLVADLLVAAGAQRVISMDLHADQIAGFFSIPFDHLYAKPALFVQLEQLVRRYDNPVIVAPDAGGVSRARIYSQRLKSPLAIIDKRRPEANKTEVMNVIGSVEGRTAIIIDDMIDTAGTLTKAAEVLHNQGASSVHAFASHAVLSGPAIERIQNSCLETVVVTNTIQASKAARACSKIKYVSIASVFGDAIERVHGDRSVSSLFDDPC